MTRHPELPERDRRILGVLVQAYIDPGEPVSSLWLASRGFGVSSATLRNVMARLEEQGYVRRPHTSAGRVPTDQGYRIYVDQLLAERRTSPSDSSDRSPAPPGRDCRRHAVPRISGGRARFAPGRLCHCTRRGHECSNRLDFVPLDGGKLLVIVVAAGGHVSHKVMNPSEEYGPGELQQAANYLNQEFKGRSLLDIRQAVLERLRKSGRCTTPLMARALRLASTTFEDIDIAPIVFIQGTSLHARRSRRRGSGTDADDATDAAPDD